MVCEGCFKDHDDYFWHCKEGVGSATCNKCKTPNYFPEVEEEEPAPKCRYCRGDERAYACDCV